MAFSGCRNQLTVSRFINESMLYKIDYLIKYASPFVLHDRNRSMPLAIRLQDKVKLINTYIYEHTTTESANHRLYPAG